ncbi:MAG TPA: cytochrome c [Bacteroidia bacterium]|nr:cytochrome c [Bacteroidia bacterium]
MRKLFFVFAMLWVPATLVYSCSSSGGTKPERTETSKAPIFGSQIYSDNCVICHGKDGKAQMSGATDLSTSVLSHDATLDVVTNGRNGMRGFGSQLTKEEMDAVVKHIESLR